MPHNDFAHLLARGGSFLPVLARVGRSRLRAIALAFGATLLGAATTAAQSIPPATAQQVRPYGEDASTIPGGMFRLRTLPTWMWTMDQWTPLLGQRRLIPLAGQLAGDSLGVEQITPAAKSQELIRDLSGLTGFKLNLGNSQTSASTRTLVVPIILEYGVNRWLTIGVNMPIVSTRTRLALLLNNDTSTYPPSPPNSPPFSWDYRYNVGVNPAFGNTEANAAKQSINTKTVAALTSIAANLRQCLSANVPACAANQAAVQALIVQATRDSALVTNLYGTSPTTGQQFVPLFGSAAQQAIDGSIRALEASANGFLDNDVSLGTDLLSAAQGPAGSDALAQLLEAARYDSVGESSRVGVGDIEVGAKLRFLDLRDASGRGVRAAATGLVRFGTGQIAVDSPFGQGTGDGQTDFVGALFVDGFITRRIGLSFAGRYTVQTGETEAFMPDASGALDILNPAPSSVALGNILELDVTPRYRVAASFSVDARYSLARQAGSTFTALPDTIGTSEPLRLPVTTPATTLQRIGLGATYSTLEPWTRHAARLPVDVLFSFLQTVSSSGGPAYRTSFAQIELRLYFAVFGGR